MSRFTLPTAIVMIAAIAAVPGAAQAPTAAVKADARDFARTLIPRNEVLSGDKAGRDAQGCESGRAHATVALWKLRTG